MRFDLPFPFCPLCLYHSLGKNVNHSGDTPPSALLTYILNENNNPTSKDCLRNNDVFLQADFVKLPK